MLGNLAVWEGEVLMPCGDGPWSLQWVEVKNTGGQMEVASPPSVPFMTKERKSSNNSEEKELHRYKLI